MGVEKAEIAPEDSAVGEKYGLGRMMVRFKRGKILFWILYVFCFMPDDFCLTYQLWQVGDKLHLTCDSGIGI